jgi:hypothetical protein
VATRTAGVAEFGATLLWDRAEDAPPGPTLSKLPGRVRCSVVETDAPGEARRDLLGEVLALTRRDLGLALGTVLRSLTATAALSGAVLETRVVRVAHPEVPPSGVVQALAHDLWNAGFPVRFGPSWTPSPHSAVAVGFRGDEAELTRFFGKHPSWEMA